MGVRTLLILILALALIQPAMSVEGCTIFGGAGPSSDFYCDGVPDNLDNCPVVPNSDQRDMNRNGVGDFCDLLIEEIIVNPDNHLKQGEFAHLVVRMINNRQHPIQDVSVTVRNSRIGWDATQEVSFIPAGEQSYVDFWLRIPKCQAQGSYSLSVGSSFSEGRERATEAQSQTIHIDSNDVCGTADGPLDTSIINVFDRADLDKGESILTPITITNFGDSQETYHMTVEGAQDWSTWRIDPASSMTLQPGHQDTGYLYLKVDDDAMGGTRTLTLTVTSDGQQTQIPVRVFVREPYRTGTGFFVIMQGILLALLILLIIIAIVIGILRLTRRQEKVSIEQTKKGRKTYY